MERNEMRVSSWLSRISSVRFDTLRIRLTTSSRLNASRIALVATTRQLRTRYSASLREKSAMISPSVERLPGETEPWRKTS